MQTRKENVHSSRYTYVQTEAQRKMVSQSKKRRISGKHATYCGRLQSTNVALALDAKGCEEEDDDASISASVR